MNREDLKQMFIIMSLSRAIDDTLLMIDDSRLKQMNKVIFKRLSKESKNLYKNLEKTLGTNIDVMDDMCDLIHKAINDAEMDIQ